MGLTDVIVEDFIRSLADKRLQSIGLEKLYDVKNPITWFEEAGHINNGETNFFEGKNSSYVAGGSLEW
jgi:ribonucleoside-diphosphate reductase beta chain